MNMTHPYLQRLLVATALTTAAFTATFGQTTDRGFIHPGALHTQADFDRIKAMLDAGDATITAAYNKLANNEYSQATVKTYPTEKIIRGGGSGENYMNAARGAAMAYQNALRWKIKGTKANADNAVTILNSWARTCKAVGGDSNQSLAAGLYGYAFANAAELMRDYEGWNKEDFEAFKKWILDVWYPRSVDFLRRRHDTWGNGTPGHYWSNWGLCNAIALMSYGILCDDVFIYNQGVSFYELDQVGSWKAERTAPIDNDGLTEFIGNLVPAVAQDARGPYGYLGQMQESGRDQGHALMAAGLATDLCQIGWNQGDDLFSLKDNRLAAGLEFVAAYNSGTDDLPWTEYWYHDVRTAYDNSWKQTAPNAGGRGQFRPYWDRVIGHYEGVKGVSMNFAHLMRDKEPIDNGGGAYGQTSGGFDHMGFSTLTCYRPKIEADKVPTRIIPAIVYNKKTYAEQSVMGGTVNPYNTTNATTLPKGSQLTLCPSLPDSVSDTGKWKWSTGATTKNLDITADSSHIYRVTYTNDKGVESTQMFSIAVKGDCSEETLTPYVTINGTTTNDTIVNVIPKKGFTLGVNGKAGWGSYKWNTGETTSSIDIAFLNTDRTYTLTYTTQGGRTEKVNFHAHVLNLSPSLTVNNGKAIYTDTYIAKQGDNITLKPVCRQIGGTWSWSDGSTNQYVTIEKIQHTSKLTVTYDLDGEKEQLDFAVYLPVSGAKTIADGTYYIKDVANGKYLTNDGSMTPVFTDEKEEEDASQVWSITKDGERYKIVSTLDDKFLNEYGVFSSNPYYTSWNSYSLFGVEDGDLYSIRNGGSAGTAYWTINSDGTINGKGSTSLTDYPFMLVPILTTGIQTPGKDGQDIDLRQQGHLLTVQGGKGLTTVTVYDAQGAVVGRAQATGMVTMHMDQLPHRLYIAKAQTPTGSRKQKTIG